MLCDVLVGKWFDKDGIPRLDDEARRIAALGEAKASMEEIKAAVDAYGQDHWKRLVKQIDDYELHTDNDLLLMGGTLQFDGLDAFKSKVNDSQKFFLTTDFASASLDNLATQETVLKAREWFRLIHDPMWLEWQVAGVDDFRMGALFFSKPLPGGEDAIMCYVVSGISNLRRKGFDISLYRIFPESIRLSDKGYEIDLEDENGRLLDDATSHAKLSLMAYDFIIRLNSPRITEFRPCEDLSRLNKKRVRTGKLPLCTYQVVDLTREIKADMKLANCEGEGNTRFHWRRGHFKLLSGPRYKEPGLHWWNPHTAGRKAYGEIKKDYVA